MFRPGFLHGALLLGVLAAGASAQSASYMTFGRSCANAAGPQLRLSGTPPSRGDWARVDLVGPPGRIGGLNIGTVVFAQGIDLTSAGMTGCRSYLHPTYVHGNIPFWTDSRGRAAVSYFVPASLPLGHTWFHQAWASAPGANPAGKIWSNGGRAVVGRGRPLGPTEIRALAPIVRLHPDEQYMPMDPMRFIAASRLRWHRSWRSDRGFNKRTRRWVTTNSHHRDYYDVPVSTINLFRGWSNGDNRRPRDANAGRWLNVFLQPRGRPTGVANPNYLVPVFYFHRRVGTLDLIQYWWFFGFNDATPGRLFDHQGDWEHVTLHVRNRRIVGAYFAAHTGGRYYRRSRMRFSGSRPVVYIAKGTHAAYPSPGRWHTLGTDRTADGGRTWDTFRRLRPLAAQPWRDFAGAWGEVGLSSITTGPLGPWYKRLRP